MHDNARVKFRPHHIHHRIIGEIDHCVRCSNPGQSAYRNAMMPVLSSSGDDAAYASWRVAPDGRLVRVQNDPQSTRTMTVTLLPGNSCRLEVVDQLKPDFSEYAFLRISTHTIGYFSTYRVTRTFCTIH